MRNATAKREYDREYQRRRRETQGKPFVAIDGEGVTNADGEHRYTLLCASNGASVTNNLGLTFNQVISFLMEVRRNQPGCILVGFGLNYDINCWLHNLGLDFVINNIFDRSADEPMVYVEQLRRRVYLDWKPGKSFTIGFAQHKGKKEHGFTIYDVFGFFQAPFARACRDYGIGIPDDIAMIERYKAQRADFTPQTDIEEMRRYCLKECEYLAQLMEQQRNLWEGLGYGLRRWDGAGAGAAELLRTHGVKGHMEQATTLQIPEVLAAFYGGRFESCILGEIPQAYSHDLHSAYASAMVKLPCLTGARFEAIADADAANDIGDGLALMHVRWECPEDAIIGPFPYRTKDDRICYPTDGEGWYWNVEVSAAALRYPGSITVVDCQRLILDMDNHCDCGGYPFRWVDAVYQQRLALKQAGDMRERPLKLALAACYGKFAQGVGGASWQNFVWAGLITATIRARMMEAIWRNNGERDVICIATDGIYSKVPLGVVSGTALGTWECGMVTDLFMAGNGLLRMRCLCNKDNGCEQCHGTGFVVKSRGFGKGEHVPWEHLIAAFRRDNVGASVKVNLHRFIGASLARHLTDKSKWCTWMQGSEELEVMVDATPRTTDFATVRVASPGRIPASYSLDGFSLRTWPNEAPSDAPSKPHKVKSLRQRLETQEDLNQIVDGELNSD